VPPHAESFADEYSVAQASSRWWVIAPLLAAFVLLFALLSPIYYLNRWDFRRHTKRNPFYTSKLVRLQARYPLLYELAMLAQNFPIPHRVYRALPHFSGDVLQVGCGTGLLNRHLRGRSDICFTNMDSNANALRLGVRLRRYSRVVHAHIDKRTPLQDRSFDAILFARSFHHVRSHKKALRECSRLLRDGGVVIIFDPVVLGGENEDDRSGYVANSSIDGLIWRFTRDTLAKHLRDCLPPTLFVSCVRSVRQLHVTNYNLFVPQTDVIAILKKEESSPCT
jgi:SAM-dependent methyltransferase